MYRIYTPIYLNTPDDESVEQNNSRKIVSKIHLFPKPNHQQIE